MVSPSDGADLLTTSAAESVISTMMEILLSVQVIEKMLSV